METPIGIEMNIRKDNIAQLMYNLLNDVALNTEVGLSLLDICKAGLEVYKYSAVNTKLFTGLDDLAVNGTVEQKEFLNHVTDSGYTVLQVIKVSLI